jgi:hypothetical protein
MNALAQLGSGRFWAQIEGHPALWVSIDGEVASLKQRKPRLVKPIMCGAYRAVNLTAKRKAYIHALVLETFAGSRPSGAQARHLDGDRFNNRLSNLAWGTPAENSADKARHGTAPVGERNPQARLTVEAVAELRAAHAAGGVSYTQLAKKFGVSTMTAWRAIRGESWR